MRKCDKIKVVVKLYTEIILKTYDLVDEIKSNNVFTSLKNLNKEIEVKYSDLLNEYHKKFKVFEEAYNIGPYYPNYKNVLKEYQAVKTELFLKEEVKKYFKLEEELNKYLEDLMAEIANYISPHILKKELVCSVK